MSLVELAILRLPHGRGLPTPGYATPGSAGMDLYAAVEAPLRLSPGERGLVPTGLAMALPEGYEGQVRARSGLALKKGLAVLNAPGTIDSDYRGEVAVILVNLGTEDVEIARGDRIAQLVVAPVTRVAVREREALPESGRGAGGFGSTGR